MSNRTRYAQVGLGGRSWMYSIAIARQYAERAELVGLCDRNAGRLQHRGEFARAGGCDAGMYDASGFDRMISERRPDCVIVTTDDCHHDHYVCRAMELGCDVITEKPMTIDAERCQRILDTRARTGRSLRVTFNYRYSPPRRQIRKLLMDGAIGDVLSVDFHWWLDTRHGADYFRRWHRRKENSGGLLVHKATHHLDLVNWWLDSVPELVHATGRRAFYTPQGALRYGLSRRSERCLDCVEAPRCPFHLDLASSPHLKAIYLDHEHHDGYHRDQCVFSDQIDIEDSAALTVTYATGARLSYSLNAFMPKEGYTVAFNGSRGRLEHECEESSYVSGDGSTPGEQRGEATSIRLRPHFGEPVDLDVWTAEGAHGGGDAGLLRDLFAPGDEPDPLGCAADHRAGAWSILTGIAANRSIESGEPVATASLVSGLERPHAH